MSVLSAALRELIAAGLTGDALVGAMERIEASQGPTVTVGAARMRRYRERKASQSVTCDVSDEGDAGDGVLSETKGSPKPLLKTQPISQPPSGPPSGNPHGSVGEQFDAFWRAVPKRIGKRTAEVAFRRALGRTDLATILAGLERMAEDDGWRRGYVPHPATWLNRDGWEDEPDGPKAAPVTGGMVAAASDELAVRSLKAKFEREEREREIGNSGRNQSVVVALPEATARGGGSVSLARGFR